MIPRIFLNLDLRVRDPQAALRQAEVTLIERIRALPEEADRTQLIGVDAGASLKRMPSAIYWGGLGAWGVRLDDRARIGDVLEQMGRGETCWAELPSVPESHMDDFNLTGDEADWIVDHCASLRGGKTLLGHLMSNAREVAHIEDLTEVKNLGLDAILQRQLDHALAFAQTVHGAALLYNLMLAERFTPVSVSAWEKELDDWRSSKTPRAEDARALIAPLLEAGSDIGFVANPMTIKFVDAWLDVMRDPTSKNARDLIISRERQAKPGRARLQLDGDYKWNGNSGAGRLTYRWGRVHRYLQDIAQAKQYP